MTRIGFDEMKETIRLAFVKAGMDNKKAGICAEVHTESSRDGVYSHGLNRVERFIEYIEKGWVDVSAEPSVQLSMGNFEVWNGNLGPGVLNAIFAMDRAMEIASVHGLGWVSMNNTTHWMRGGSYGWQAIGKGFMAICWTNTESCMPPWGAKSQAIGNNPLVMAIPHENGPLLLDMAMSQYSYGKLQVQRLKNEKLPFPGGFSREGQLTDEPGLIEESRRILPTGYWKGSGLAIILDLFAAITSGGLTAPGMDKLGKGFCGGCSQVFIAFDPLRFNTKDYVEQTINDTVNQVKNADRAVDNEEIFYPGELSLRRREENLRLGIPVDDEIWERVKRLAEL